ncbi:hypothetical protein D3C86_1321020 [compost metagenome]
MAMMTWARCLGDRPRRSARPCSVTMTCTSWVMWSTWLAMGTMAEILPPLAVEGVTKQEM